MTQQYGQLDGMDDTQLAGIEAMRLADKGNPERKEADITLPDQGNLLWSYINEGRIYGVPVVREHQGLKLDTDELVANAFELIRRPRSMVLLINTEATEDQDKYNALLDAVADGRVEIVDELKQFDPAKSAFLTWVRYNELSFRLHPRYSYLLEE